MRDSWQILADLFDSLIRRERGRIPSEVARLFDLGLRLHNECPDIDPAFMQRLRQQVEAGLTAQERTPRPLLRVPARLLSCSRLRRVALAGAVSLVILLGLAALHGVRGRVQASLVRIAAVFRPIRVEEQPRVMVPQTPPPRQITQFASIAEAQQMVSFRVRAPAYLPESVKFSRACVEELDGGQRVYLYYRLDDADVPAGIREGGEQALAIQEVPVALATDQGDFSVLVGTGSAERIEIAGRPALWVSGWWNRKGAWTRTSRGGTVLVQDDEVFYHVRSECSRAETLRIVESLFE
ncbi:MAG: hypothetical protein QME94_07640 [Anaerolineae bacterium]|nr:hypothetical protein [Anaerolineae bacterium]